MAMTFTLVSHLREQLSLLVRVRAENLAKAETEKERLAIEVLLLIIKIYISTDCGYLFRKRRHERGAPL